VTVLFREVYSGITTIPSNVTDFIASATMANEDAMDTRANETDGPALIVLQGSFTVTTEDPTEFRSGATKVGRGEILSTAQSVYDMVEADFRTVYARFSLFDLGGPPLDIGLDSGKVTFSRVFSTTKVRKWRERTTIRNVDPKVFNRDYKGKDTMHIGMGGPIATLHHELHIETLEAPRAYIPPNLTSGWERTDIEQDINMSAKLRGGRLIFVTDGATNWRYVNPSERGESGQTGAAGRIIEQSASSIGSGTI
jgi:hypothetical protein